MMNSFTGKATLAWMLTLVLFSVSVHVNCQEKTSRDGVENGIREKRGAAYAGGHPGSGGYAGGVGIPGITNVIQYSAYNTLLNSGQHSSGSGSGYGGSSHGQKLTVDQAIGMFGHHTLNRPYPYSSGHNGGGGSSGHQGGGGGGGGGYGAGGGGAGRASY